MSWNKLDRETHQKIFDKLMVLACQEEDPELANAILLASDELELWTNETVFYPKAKAFSEAVEGQDPSLEENLKIEERKSFTYAILGICSTVGAVMGAQLFSIIDVDWVLPGSLFGAVVAGLIGYLASRKND